MKNLSADIKQIYHDERFMFVLMIFNFILSVILFIVDIVNLNPSSAVVKTGYGDRCGYRNGSREDILAFSVLAIVFGVFHNFIAIRIFKKRGAGMTKFFLLTTATIIMGTFIVLFRLLEKF